MMEREKAIEQVLWALKNLWLQHPEQRLGQLLENYAFPITLTKQGGRTALTFFQEDEETFKKLILNTDFKHPPVNHEKVNDK
jgi:hypothetical protein